MIKTAIAVAGLLAGAASGAWARTITPVSVPKSLSFAAVENPAGLSGAPGAFEVFVQGAVTFEHAGRKYALKILFSRAIYDAGINTYRAGLRYQLSDYTAQDVISLWLPINPETTPLAEYLNSSDGTKLRIESGKRGVEITAETDGKSRKYKFSASEMLGNWEENAKSYRREFGGAVWHFVPQVVWQQLYGRNWYSRGFAVSGEWVLDALTGRPLDAVRLCSSADNWLGCTVGNGPTSMASGLAFDQRAEQEGGALKTWIMDAEVMRLVMRDELAGRCWHYNCDKTGVDFNDW